MTYHPIMGVAIFFIFLLLAFCIGRKSNSIRSNNNILYLVKNKNKNKNKKNNSDSINPDADWLE